MSDKRAAVALSVLPGAMALLALIGLLTPVPALLACAAMVWGLASLTVDQLALAPTKGEGPMIALPISRREAALAEAAVSGVGGGLLMATYWAGAMSLVGAFTGEGEALVLGAGIALAVLAASLASIPMLYAGALRRPVRERMLAVGAVLAATATAWSSGSVTAAALAYLGFSIAAVLAPVRGPATVVGEGRWSLPWRGPRTREGLPPLERLRRDARQGVLPALGRGVGMVAAMLLVWAAMLVGVHRDHPPAHPLTAEGLIAAAVAVGASIAALAPWGRFPDAPEAWDVVPVPRRVLAVMRARHALVILLPTVGLLAAAAASGFASAGTAALTLALGVPAMALDAARGAWVERSVVGIATSLTVGWLAVGGVPVGYEVGAAVVGAGVALLLLRRAARGPGVRPPVSRLASPSAVAAQVRATSARLHGRAEAARSARVADEARRGD